MAKKLFTSESVTEGHPDKVCDQISDAVLDAIFEQDPQAHVACEVTATTGMIHVMGEISTTCYVDIPAVTREVVKSIGYDDPACGFDGNTCAVLTAIGLGTTFYNPNWRVVCYTFLGTVFTVVAQGALNVLLNVYGIPTLTFPFVVAAWIFLLPNIDLLPKNYQS